MDYRTEMDSAESSASANAVVFIYRYEVQTLFYCIMNMDQTEDSIPDDNGSKPVSVLVIRESRINCIRHYQNWIEPKINKR